jgi:hypothetical protein
MIMIMKKFSFVKDYHHRGCMGQKTEGRGQKCRGRACPWTTAKVVEAPAPAFPSPAWRGRVARQGRERASFLL